MNYIEINTENGATYIRKDKLDEISQVDVIVFDCDGVLLDVRNAYNVAIAATTKQIIKAFTGSTVPESIFDSRLNHAYKRTGGFNNDWTHAYAVIMRILSELPREKLESLNKYAEESLRYASPKERYDYISGKVKADIPVEGLYDILYEFAEELDASGIDKVDQLLLDNVGVNIKKALKFRADVGDSIISTLFEELFLGNKLFKETFGYKPQFVEVETGIVEADEVVVKPETLTELEKILGGPRFGVASGSMRNTACHALGSIVDSIPLDSQYWHDIVERDMQKLGEPDLHKPNPYPLKKAAEPYNPKRVLYVGDTMADYLTAENAGEDYLFTGVYASVHSGENVKENFMELGADLVAPTVNEIPMILRYARENQ